MGRVIWYGGAAALLGLALWSVLSGEEPDSSPPPDPAAAEGAAPRPVSPRPLPTLGGPDDPPSEVLPELAPSGLPRPTDPRPVSSPALSDMQRAAALRRRLALRAPVPVQPTAVEERPPEGPMARPEAIRQAVNRAKPAVADCYDQLLEISPEAAGKLVVEFTFEAADGAGKLVDATIPEDGLNHPFMGMCVLKALAEVDFPEPQGEGAITVRYPFTFAPGGPDDDEE